MRSFRVTDRLLSTWSESTLIVATVFKPLRASAYPAIYSSWFDTPSSPHAHLIHYPASGHLHSIRKAAKLARYQAEIAPGYIAVWLTVKRYESLREAGGTWHDWLDLASFAAGKLGEDHPNLLEAKRKVRRQDVLFR